MRDEERPDGGAGRVVPQPAPLRILYVVHGFPPDTWAGTEVYTLELALEMQRRGHEVAVVTRAPAQAGEADWNVRETEFSALRVFRVARRVEELPLGESYRPQGAGAVFERLLDDVQPQLVHFQHLLHLSVDWIDVVRTRHLASVYTANDYWALCARVQLQRTDGVRCERNQGMGCFPCIKDKNPRLIPWARRLFPLAHPWVRLLARFGSPDRTGSRMKRFTQSWIDLCERQDHVLERFAAVDLTVAPSRFLREKLLESGRFDLDRVIHSDYGMRAAKEDGRRRTPAPEGRTRFGFIGSLVEYKGIGVLVRAMRRLRGQPCELSVFGDYRPDEDPYHARLTGLAEAAAVHFRGRFDNDRLAEVFREIDVLVVPSTWYENSPLVIHEAFLHQTPVVTSDIGGMAELVRDGINGLHFGAADEVSLARVLERFATETDLVDRLSRDFPTFKTPAEDASLMEGRYRSILGSKNGLLGPS